MARSGVGAGVRRVRALVLLLAVTAFAMTGCLRYELSISLNDDGSGALGQLLAISDAFAAATGTGTDAFIPADAFPPGTDVEVYSQDGFTGVEVGVPFGTIQQLGLITGGASQQAGGISDFGLQPNDSGGWSFSTVIAPQESNAAAGAAAGSPLPPELLQGAFFRVRVALPGHPAEHNADRIEDGAFVWDIDFAAAGSRQLLASTSASAPEPPDSGHGPATLDGAVAPEDGSAAAAAAPAATRAALAVAGLLAALALVWRFGARARRHPSA